MPRIERAMNVVTATPSAKTAKVIVPTSKHQDLVKVNRLNSPLLRLSPELQIIIASYALISSKSSRDPQDLLKIGTAATAPPALTQTCYQLRNISRSLFYTKNFFYIEISDYNARPLLTWMAIHISLPDPTEPNVLVDASEITSPDAARINLMAWLKGVILGSRTAEPCAASWEFSTAAEYDAGDAEARLWKIFDQAREMRQSGLSWDEARPMLRMAIDMAGVLGER